MFASTRHLLKSNTGSALLIAILVIVTMSILAVGFAIVSNTETKISGLQKTEAKAFYVAQAGLDRAVYELMQAGDWRVGFTNVPFDAGSYDVTIYDGSDDGAGVFDPTIAEGYVRIESDAEIHGVRRQLEAVWVSPVAAFQYALAGGNSVHLDNHGTPSAVVTADVHNNSWGGGEVRLDGGTRIYGNVTAVGDVRLNTGTATDPALIYGDVWANGLTLESPNAEIRSHLNLSEAAEGRDLNGDGDVLDMVTKGLADVIAETFVDASSSLSNGDTDPLIGGGSQPVVIGDAKPQPISDPRPDFGKYYEFVTGGTAYPPGGSHVTTAIPGDGDGHYFDSDASFQNWLNTIPATPVVCWRCAGDGAIKSDNSVVCPTCGGTGLDTAVEVSGVFYIDDALVDLSNYPDNLVIHGSIITAQGDPNSWGPVTVNTPGGPLVIDNFPLLGEFQLKGHTQHFSQTYRSSVEGGPYVWNTREYYNGVHLQLLPILEPQAGEAMKEFPAVIAALEINLKPLGKGQSYYTGDIGDERMAIFQGVMYAEGQVHAHGSGGGKQKPETFEEDKDRKKDDKIDEKKYGIDLNGDGDMDDKVKLQDITTVPVVFIGGDKYWVDINVDGVFETVSFGGWDYNDLFRDAGGFYPILIYHEGVLLSQEVHVCEHYLILFDPGIAARGMPFGFGVGDDGFTGMVSWHESIPE